MISLPRGPMKSRVQISTTITSGDGVIGAGKPGPEFLEGPSMECRRMQRALAVTCRGHMFSVAVAFGQTGVGILRRAGRDIDGMLLALPPHHPLASENV